MKFWLDTTGVEGLVNAITVVASVPAGEPAGAAVYVTFAGFISSKDPSANLTKSPAEKAPL